MALFPAIRVFGLCVKDKWPVLLSLTLVHPQWVELSGPKDFTELPQYTGQQL